MSADSSDSRFQLLGFTLPLNFLPYAAQEGRGMRCETRSTNIPFAIKGADLFSTALNPYHPVHGSSAPPMITLRELTMLHIMNHVTDKPDWANKVFDDEIVKKWKDEAMAAEGRDVTQKMIDWIIEELKYKAEVFQKTRIVNVYNGDVVFSDSAIPGQLKDRLKAGVSRLENIPEVDKDFHPRSDDKVLDLVHPSLFPLVFGRSRILPKALVGIDECIERCGEGETIPIPMKADAKYSGSRNSFYNCSQIDEPYSRKFQWLPCEVKFGEQHEVASEDAKAGPAHVSNVAPAQVKIVSYINNLHPEMHKGLYTVIEEIITRAIPLWNVTLSALKTHHYSELRIPYTSAESDLNYDADVPGLERRPYESHDDFFERRGNYVDANKSRWNYVDANRKAIQPEPGQFQPPYMRENINKKTYNPRSSPQEAFYEEGSDKPRAGMTVDLVRDYGYRGLQVIVKLANILLTPEKPKYEGGTWHVEGMLNEHICAIALYYYDNHNISESRLAFRQVLDPGHTTDINYEQDYSEWLTDIFGLYNEDAAVQEVGDVLCREDRLLTFPNILQHRVKPFRLADSSRPGHRKILALFLVDPNIHVISTANIPIQQRHWWSEKIRSSASKLTELAPELQNKIFEDVDDFPISMDEAKKLRLELMEERKRFVIEHNELVENIVFSLCEH